MANGYKTHGVVNGCYCKMMATKFWLLVLIMENVNLNDGYKLLVELLLLSHLIFCQELTDEQKQEIKEAFDLFDTDGSGLQR